MMISRKLLKCATPLKLNVCAKSLLVHVLKTPIKHANIYGAANPAIFSIMRTNTIHTSSIVLQIKKENQETKGVDIRRENPYDHLTFGQKVAQVGTDFTYLLVIAAGVGIMAILFYSLGSELFSTSGPNAVYSASVEKCLNSIEVQDALGSPISAHGEGRRRRQHVQHVEFMTNNGEKHTRVQFYLKGAFRTAVVYAETFVNNEGKREFEYLVVDCEGYPPKKIVLEKREQPSLPTEVAFY